MQLRDYQNAGADAVLADFAEKRSTLGVAATGLGKTVIFAEVLRRRPAGRAMVLAHREELINQAADKIRTITCELPDIEMADSRACHGLHKARIIIASKDSLRGQRRDRFDPFEFSTLITDEAHHAVAGSYTDIYKHFGQNPQLKHVGMTATPDRTDEAALGRVFEAVAFDYGIEFGIRNGWLVNIVQNSVPVEHLDFSQARTTAGDLNAADLAAIMEQERVLHETADPTIQLAGDRKSLVFSPSLKHAELLCDILNRHRPGSARWLSGNSTREERAETLRDFAARRIQFLVNCAVFTEGFDEPSIELVVMARATKSRSLYSQMVGRGTRPLPGVVDGLGDSGARRDAIARSGKPQLEVLDFVGNCGKHKLVSVADILGGNYDDEVIAAVAKIVRESPKPTCVLDELESLERQLAEKRARAIELARRSGIIGKAKYDVVPVDPFDVFAMHPWRERAWHKGRDATPGQVGVMERAGVPEAKGKTFTQASQIIDEIVRRQREGRVGYMQAKKLAALGYDTNMSVGEAMNILRKHRRAG